MNSHLGVGVAGGAAKVGTTPVASTAAGDAATGLAAAAPSGGATVRSFKLPHCEASLLLLVSPGLLAVTEVHVQDKWAAHDGGAADAVDAMVLQLVLDFE